MKEVSNTKALEFLRQIEASGKHVIVTDKWRPTIEVRRYRSPLERLRGSVIELTVPFSPVGEKDWKAMN